MTINKSPPNLFLQQSVFLIFIAALILSLTNTVSAAENEWQARLSPMPVAFGTRNSITGLGVANAMLDDNKLIVNGSFYGLQGKALVAHIHLGPKAIPGPAILELTVETTGDGKQGKLSGTVELTPEQIQALNDESLYIQISSEAAKDGNLRGWLLPN